MSREISGRPHRRTRVRRGPRRRPARRDKPCGGRARAAVPTATPLPRTISAQGGGGGGGGEGGECDRRRECPTRQVQRKRAASRALRCDHSCFRAGTPRARLFTVSFFGVGFLGFVSRSVRSLGLIACLTCSCSCTARTLPPKPHTALHSDARPVPPLHGSHARPPRTQQSERRSGGAASRSRGRRVRRGWRRRRRQGPSRYFEGSLRSL